MNQPSFIRAALNHLGHRWRIVFRIRLQVRLLISNSKIHSIAMKHLTLFDATHTTLVKTLLNPASPMAVERV